MVEEMLIKNAPQIITSMLTGGGLGGSNLLGQTGKRQGGLIGSLFKDSGLGNIVSGAIEGGAIGGLPGALVGGGLSLLTNLFKGNSNHNNKRKRSPYSNIISGDQIPFESSQKRNPKSYVVPYSTSFVPQSKLAKVGSHVIGGQQRTLEKQPLYVTPPPKRRKMELKPQNKPYGMDYDNY